MIDDWMQPGPHELATTSICRKLTHHSSFLYFLYISIFPIYPYIFAIFPMLQTIYFLYVPIFPNNFLYFPITLQFPNPSYTPITSYIFQYVPNEFEFSILLFARIIEECYCLFLYSNSFLYFSNISQPYFPILLLVSWKFAIISIFLFNNPMMPIFPNDSCCLSFS
jgi:hypothetical protein